MGPLVVRHVVVDSSAGVEYIAVGAVAVILRVVIINHAIVIHWPIMTRFVRIPMMSIAPIIVIARAFVVAMGGASLWEA